MILQQRQEILNKAFKNIEAINRRRAYISTKYTIARNRTDKQEEERYKQELESINAHAKGSYEKLRELQTKYLVEYDGVQATGIVKAYSVELYLLNSCDINTFDNGWDLEDGNTQDLLYEIADFLLTYRFTEFAIKNIKKIS